MHTPRARRRLACSLAAAALLGAGVGLWTFTGRPLAPGEIEALRSVFGDRVDYRPVRVAALPLPPAVTAFVIGNRIHVRRGYYRDDFSAEPLPMSTLVHEVAHVWHWQSGRYWPGLAAFERLRLGGAVYGYGALDGTRPLGEYRYEQQAKILEDYYLARARGEDVARYERAMGDALPP